MIDLSFISHSNFSVKNRKSLFKQILNHLPQNSHTPSKIKLLNNKKPDRILYRVSWPTRIRTLDDVVRVRCLTAWRWANVLSTNAIIHKTPMCVNTFFIIFLNFFKNIFFYEFSAIFPN